ncbi:hypothetical protein [Antarcticimicrobium sediminis]|uniref:Tripartite tricarboxylate transporter TctB family protein n=1 Tax=Antarcticimicrobium sediminis TaxID=2546227 RepID=A0A4V2Z6Z9_9RHOB|nr:hypothetical protein [Antarcticimicrobium sediminis]TDE34646.1 hypothetical protein E1B25_19100 [Antarcticimicrobium sediminis]
MSLRLAPSHAVFLAIVLAFTVAMNYSAITAKFALNNLVILVPASVLALILIGTILLSRPIPEDVPEESLRKTLGDLLLLGLFCGFCSLMFVIGFDVATFFFIWIGIVVCGERSLWKPPAFALAFAVVVTTTFGALFPFPIVTLVLQ